MKVKRWIAPVKREVPTARILFIVKNASDEDICGILDRDLQLQICQLTIGFKSYEIQGLDLDAEDASVIAACRGFDPDLVVIALNDERVMFDTMTLLRTFEDTRNMATLVCILPANAREIRERATSAAFPRPRPYMSH
jgi:hypothetical protein